MRCAKDMLKSTFELLRRKKAFSALIGALATLSMIVTASLAWFSMNRHTNANEMGMGLSVDDTIAVYNVYMYDLEKGEGTTKDANGEDLTISNLDLNQYDTIFRVHNEHTPAFAKIELTRNSSMQEGSVYITITKNSENGTTAFPSAFSSSVLRFTGFVVEDKSDYDAETPDDLYTLINDAKFSDVEKYQNNDNVDRPFSKTFVSTSGDSKNHTHAKVQSITLEIPYTKNAWRDNGDGTETLNVYLYITYDVTLIECYMNENSNNNLSLDQNTIFFENDLDMVSVSTTNDED